MKCLIVTVLNKLSFNCPICFRPNYVLLPQMPSLTELALGYPLLVEEGFAGWVVKRLHSVAKFGLFRLTFRDILNRLYNRIGWRLEILHVTRSSRSFWWWQDCGVWRWAFKSVIRGTSPIAIRRSLWLSQCGMRIRGRSCWFLAMRNCARVWLLISDSEKVVNFGDSSSHRALDIGV